MNQINESLSEVIPPDREPTMQMTQTNINQWEEDLHQSLSLFEFTIPLPNKSTDTLRLFYNNCNGIEINHTIEVFLKQKRDKKQYNYLKDADAPTKLDSILRQMKLWQVDLVCLAELCVAWEDQIPRRVVQQITSQYDTTGCWSVASSKPNVGSFCKPGGTGILAQGNSNGRIIDRGSDPWAMGRWSYITLAGKTNRKFLVVTGYRTGNRSGKIGHRTSWAQQQTMLLSNKRSEPPHLAFLTDLKEWLGDVKFADTEFLICLDANEKWTHNSEIRKWATDLELINLNHEFSLQETHPNITQYTRSTTIDYCLCSRGVLEYITYASSTPYDLDVLGDHRGFVLDIDLKQFFGDTEIENSFSKRKLRLSNPQAVEKYLQIVEDQFSQQNIYQRCKKLLRKVAKGYTDVACIMRKYEAIDKEVFGICTKAEKKCIQSVAGNYDWSPNLARAIKTLSYWRHRMRNSSRTVVSTKLEKELNIKYVSLSKDTIQQMVNSSRELLTEIQKESREHRRDHLEALAQQYANQHSMTSQQAILDLLAHEEVRSTFKILSQRMKPTSRAS